MLNQYASIGSWHLVVQRDLRQVRQDDVRDHLDDGDGAGQLPLEGHDQQDPGQEGEEAGLLGNNLSEAFFGAVIVKTYHEYEEEVVEYHLQVKSPAYERTKEARDQTKNGAVDCLPKKDFF